mgnify:CR=1 FL=1
MTNSAGSKLGRRISGIVLAIFTLIWMFPLVWMFFMSFKTNSEIYAAPLSLPQHLNLDNFARALETLNIGRMYVNTLIVAVLSVGLGFLVTFLSSYALCRMVFRNKRLQRGLLRFFQLGLMISPFILLFPIYRITVQGNLYNSIWSLVLPYIATQVSFNTLLMYNFFKGLPAEIEEAALIDGCNLPQLLGRVILPMTKPVVVTVIVFNVLYVWNEYPIASVLLRDENMYTLSMGASMFKGAYSVDNAGIIAASVLIIVPELIFYGFLQRYIVDGMVAGAVKG